MEGGRRRIDRILLPSFLDGIEQAPLAEVRARRADCEDEETILSYERRLLQARIDILKAEMERRRAGTGGSLVDRLAEILSGERRSSRGSFPKDRPLPDFEGSKRRIERLVSDDALARAPDLSDQEIGEMVERLTEAEREVSDQRREVQRVLDALTAEVGRRYKTGEADPTDAIRGR